jgi:hypothetical protein
MNNVESTSVQERTQRICHGWAKKLSVVALSAAFLWSPMGPTIAKAESSMTQLQYLQWLAAVNGAKGLKSGNDYINWARSQGVNPSGGWDANSTLTKKDMAQTIGQLLGVSSKNGNYESALKREGVDLGGVGDQVSRNDLADFLDQSSLRDRLFTDSHGKPSTDGHGGDHTTKPPTDDHGHKVTICHKGHTIKVDSHSLQKHLDHGDTLGPCHVTKHGHDRDDDDEREHSDSHGH